MTNDATGFIATDRDMIAIYGTGPTEEAALADAQDAGPFFAADGETVIPPADALRVYPATAALLAQVKEEGGAIAWDTICGVACTIAEHEED